jgi:hypothetical protein
VLGSIRPPQPPGAGGHSIAKIRVAPGLLVMPQASSRTIDSKVIKVPSLLAARHEVVTCAENRGSPVLVSKMISAAFFVATTHLGSLIMAGKAQHSTPDLGNLSLDSLASMEITSVSRKEQTLGGRRNLLQAQHYEFGSGELVQAEPVARSAYLKADWRF